MEHLKRAVALFAEIGEADLNANPVSGPWRRGSRAATSRSGANLKGCDGIWTFEGEQVASPHHRREARGIDRRN